MKTTLEQAAIWVAEATGQCWPQDQVKVLAAVNAVRELIYDMTPAVTWDVDLCLPVRKFTTVACGCDALGISLPAYAGSILDVWADDRPLPQTSRWAIYPYDREERGTCGCGPGCAQVQLIGDDFPFMTDPAKPCSKIWIQATSHADINKQVTIRYTDSNGIPRTEPVALRDEPTALANHVYSVDRSGVSLPLGLEGRVVVKDCSGATLAEWQPSELIPGYRRYKLTGNFCVGQVIAIRAERRRAPLRDPADPVETDQMLAWQDGAKHLLLHGRTNADQNDVVNAGKFLDAFRVRIEKEIQRRLGRVRKSAVLFQGNTPRHSRLLTRR